MKRHARDEMAEREGFEPSVPVLPVRSFSKGVLSASQPPLRLGNVWGRRYTLLQMMSIHKYTGRN